MLFFMGQAARLAHSSFSFTLSRTPGLKGLKGADIVSSSKDWEKGSLEFCLSFMMFLMPSSEHWLVSQPLARKIIRP